MKFMASKYRKRVFRQVLMINLLHVKTTKGQCLFNRDYYLCSVELCSISKAA